MSLTAFEREREARIARNKERIAALELSQAANEFKACVQRRQPVKQARAPRQLCPRPVLPVLEQRRSGRLANVEAVEYCENIIDKADNKRTLRTFCASVEESYTEEHIKLLGDFKDEWVLFQDGYDENGNRIYDKASGLTCHQCRQKTLGLRTICSSCQSLKGVFCGDCLFMRYGENVKEALQNPNWTCPDCRGICNCSIHRIRKGWAPTGSLYRRALADGYKSVAHMLILTNQAKPETQPAAPQGAVAEASDAGAAANEAETGNKAAVCEAEIADATAKAGKKAHLEEQAELAPVGRRSARLQPLQKDVMTGSAVCDNKPAKRRKVAIPASGTAEKDADHMQAPVKAKTSEDSKPRSKPIATRSKAAVDPPEAIKTKEIAETIVREARKRGRPSKPPLAPVGRRVTRSQPVVACA